MRFPMSREIFRRVVGVGRAYFLFLDFIFAVSLERKRILEEKLISSLRSNNLIFLKTPSWMQHYWTPEMTIRIKDDEYSENVMVNCLIWSATTGMGNVYYDLS